MIEAYAFFDNHGIDLNLMGDSVEAVKSKTLEAHMGWRYKYPEKCSRDRMWEKIVEGGGSIRKILVQEAQEDN